MLGSFFRPILLGLSVDFLVFISCYCINCFVATTADPKERRSGSVFLTVFVLSIIILFVSTFTRVRTWTFYLVFLPLFLMSCVTLNLSIDLWRKRTGQQWILTEYFFVQDRIAQSMWAELMIFFNGIFIHFLHYITLWRSWNGYSCRSLLIFTTSLTTAIFVVIIAFAITTTVELLLQPVVLLLYLVSPWVVVTPIIAMSLKRNFTFEHTEGVLLHRTSDIFGAGAILYASASVFVPKFQAGVGYSGLHTDLVRRFDPMLLYHDDSLKDVLPFSIGVIQSWIYQFFLLPSFLINVFNMIRSKKPCFLWELYIVQSAFIIVYQCYYIAGALYWKTPTQHQIDPYVNEVFWQINAPPIVLAGLNFIDLMSIRIELVESTTETTSSTVHFRARV